MSSITDELMGKTPAGAQKTAEVTLKTMKELKSGIKGAGSAIKGICLLLVNGTEFTAESVMKAVHSVAFRKTGDIKFSKNNINISKLKESGHVYPMEENIVQDTMKYFDQQCKKYGIKYSAMKDTREQDKPSYMVFFEGKDTNLIMQALREAYKDYAEEQQRTKDAEKDKPQKEEKEKSESSPKRESVKAKLAFFRDRVTARDQERDAVEKHHQHTDIQR